jgi:hypothetical protein
VYLEQHTNIAIFRWKLKNIKLQFAHLNNHSQLYTNRHHSTKGLNLIFEILRNNLYSVFIKLQYNIENSKAEIWNKSTVLHCRIPTLNTALVFTLMIHGDLTPSSSERRALLLSIGNINTIPSRIIYKAKMTACPSNSHVIMRIATIQQ